MTKRDYFKIDNFQFKLGHTVLIIYGVGIGSKQPWKGRSFLGIGLPEKEEKQVIRLGKQDDAQEKVIAFWFMVLLCQKKMLQHKKVSLCLWVLFLLTIGPK